MKISALAALLCAAAGALAYANSGANGARAAAIAAAVAAAAFGAAYAARRRGDAVERNVADFARSLLSEKFARYDPLSQGGGSEMATLLNQAAREFRKSVRSSDEQSTRLSVFLNQIREGVLCVSAQGRVTAANKSARAMLGAGGGIVGKNYWEAILNPEIRGLIKDALEGGAEREPLRREVTNLYPAEKFYVASAARDEGRGEITLVLFDSSEMKKLERAQRDFITNASHEIRTPLTSIMGAAERIALGAGGETEKFAQILKRNTERLATLCERVISLSEMENRRGARNFSPFDLGDAARRAADVIQAAAEKRNIAIEIEENSGVTMTGDRLAIENMFVNLIENAVKYSPEGAAVKVSVSEGADGGARAAVSDSGAGIERGEVGRIFERFYRGAGAGKEAGNGLGLSIAREAAEIHGGVITVESEPGRGSVFTVSFADANGMEVRRLK